MENKKNYVIKCLNGKKEEHDFYFLRWLAEINKNEKDTNYVCNKIAKYLNNKNCILPFSDIFVIDDTVFIYTQFPGKWIGEKGHDINELQHMLNYNKNDEIVHDFKVNVMKSDNTNNYNTVMNLLHGYKKQNKN